MAEVTDGLFSGWGAAEKALFKRAIRGAMLMGQPNSVEKRLTFRWKTERTFDIADPGGDPYDWTDTPTTEDEVDDVVASTTEALGAVEFISRSTLSGGTSVAEFDTPRIIVTMLDDDYEDIFSDGRRADEIILDDAVYRIDYVAPPVGLFDVTVYQIYASADDEA